MNEKIKTNNANETFFLIFIYAFAIITGIYFIELIVNWIVIEPHSFILNNSLFFQDQNDSFMDFFNVNYFVRDNDPYFGQGSSYPPFALIIAKIFSVFSDYSIDSTVARMSASGIISLVVFFIIYLVSMFKLLEKKLPAEKASVFFILLFFSAQNMFLIQRGNYLCITLIFTAFFAVFQNSEKKWLRELSYISLGMATGMKIYPCVFALILLREKRIKSFVKCVVWSAFFLIIPFLFFRCNFENIDCFVKNLMNFSSNGSYTVMENFIEMTTKYSYDYSITTFFDLAVRFIGGKALFAIKDMYQYEHLLICAIILIISVFGSLFCEKKWQVYMYCALMTVLVPKPSFIYSGVMMFIPFVSFLREKKKDKIDYAYLVLFIIFFSPVQFGYIIPRFTEQMFYGITYSNLFSLCSLVLMLIILFCETVWRNCGKEV